MTSSVTLTAALRANLLSLQGTAKLLDTTQLRLATGKKVNSALDNPSAFFASQSLTNRAGDLSNLLDSMGQAIQVLKAADKAITSLTSLVQQAQAIAQSALNQVSSSGAFRSSDISAVQQNGLTGAAGTLSLQARNPAGVVVATATVTVTGTMTLAQLAAAINTNAGFSAQIVDGSGGGTVGGKRLEIRATNGMDLRIAASATATFLNTDQNAGGVAGSALGAALPGAYTIGNYITATSNAVDQISLESQYSTIRSNIDSLIADSGYQGTNLVNGDTLNVQFNERNTSKLSVTGVTFTAANLGISYTAGTSFISGANIQSSLSEITASLSSLRNQASKFGNNLNIVQARQDFTNNLINNLKEGSDLLTLADKNEEGANLLALQTSQQLGIQALSLASQANQSVLRLFA